jgi:dolichol-phosphate mannosyltransferase
VGHDHDFGIMPALSVVVPCFDEAAVLEEFHRRASAACRAAVGEDHEIIVVNDGSRDATWAVIERLSAGDPHLLGVNLMRNHGQQLATTAGLAVSTGQRVLLIDADLQDPPELLGDMMALMDAGADVVYGRRRSRDGESPFKRTSAAAFYRLLSRMSDVAIPEDTGDFRLLDRRIVDALLAMPERARYLRGMVSWIGGRQVPLYYERQPRLAGETKYSFGKMIRMATTAILSFSIVPLRAGVWLGLGIASLAGVLLIYTLCQWASGSVVSGWTSLMTAVALFAGVQLLVLGIMGEYLGILVEETKKRPLFLIDSVLVHGRQQRLPVEFSQLGPALRASMLEKQGRPGALPPILPDGDPAKGEPLEPIHLGEGIGKGRAEVRSETSA